MPKRAQPERYPFFKIFSREWLEGSIRFECSEAERGLFADLLAMANESRQRGIIQANPTTPYPYSWIASKLNTSIEFLEKCLQKFELQERINENADGIHIINFDFYQRELYPKKGRPPKYKTSVSGNKPPSQPGGLLNEVEEKTIIKRNDNDKDKEEKTVLGVPPSFFDWLEKLKQNQNKVGVLTEAFKLLHSKAPPEDFEVLGGRMANLFKVANKDAGNLLRIIWETAAADIAGSHLSFIQGKLRVNTGKKARPGSLPTADELERSWGEELRKE